jgi:hydrogenase expression/formation protein HypE
MNDLTLQCPLPKTDYPQVLLAHGGGGRLMQQLLGDVFFKAFDNDLLGQRHDASVFAVGGLRLAFTTDGYVVAPIFFPGGSIGDLAVHGTVNDLAMAGARPLHLSAGFIIEEGFPVADLQRVVGDMAQAAAAVGVQIITGDTKVVNRGKADGVFITTAGVGVIEHDLSIAPQSVRPGDAIILSGDIARHGIAILSVREGLQFETVIESDSAAVHEPVLGMLREGLEIHCLRDLTRGGLAAGVIEIAQTAGLQAELSEAAIPLREDVLGACEILGFDPLYVANEGRFIAILPAEQADAAVAVMRRHEVSRDAVVIGSINAGEQSSLVSLRTVTGATRVVDLLSGEQLPRIC